MCGGEFKLGSVRRAIQVLPIAFFMLNATALAIFNVLPRRGAGFLTRKRARLVWGSSAVPHRMASSNPRQYSVDLETWSITQCTCDFVSYGQ
jgi:hypothetical protein